MPTSTKPGGSKLLAITGLSLGALTIAGAVLRYTFADALWTQVWFAVAIGGLVGFATNWVAIKMLFHPRVRVFGVQGVVPSRRADLARSVGLTLEEHLISGDRMHRLLVGSGAVDTAIAKMAEHLPKLLETPETAALLQAEAARTINETMAAVIVQAKDKLREKARGNVSAMLTGATAAASFGPMAGMLAAGLTKSGIFDKLVDKMIDQMAEDLRKDRGVDDAARDIVKALPGQAERILADKELRARLTVLFEAMAGDLVNAVDVAGLVENELLARDDGDLEDLIDRVASNELVFIQVAGGGLGMIAGLALIWPWLLAPMAAAFGIMVAIARSAERKHTRNRAAAAQTADAAAQESQQPETALAVAAEPAEPREPAQTLQ
jgi:uncharacterized membrane-anchored protein YjiN (DUF445 family)